MKEKNLNSSKRPTAETPNQNGPRPTTNTQTPAIPCVTYRPLPISYIFPILLIILFSIIGCGYLFYYSLKGSEEALVPAIYFLFKVVAYGKVLKTGDTGTLFNHHKELITLGVFLLAQSFVTVPLMLDMVNTFTKNLKAAGANEGFGNRVFKAFGDLFTTLDYLVFLFELLLPLVVIYKKWKIIKGFEKKKQE